MSTYEEQSTSFTVILPANIRPSTQCLWITQDLRRSPVWTPAQGMLSHEVRPRLRALSCEGWKHSREGHSNASWALSPLSSRGKSFPLSPASLTLLSLLPRAVPIPTGITAGTLPVGDRAAQWSCPSCVGVLWPLPPLGPGPSEQEIRARWSIIIVLAVTELFTTCWSLLETKAWRTCAILLFFYMFE